jgi:CheY-like chemotaxis protein
LKTLLKKTLITVSFFPQTYPQVRTCSSTKEGLEIIMRENISLVIIDCFMKEMDGFTFLKVVKQASDRDLPVICNFFFF